MSLFSWFEKRINPYPDFNESFYSTKLLPFIWQSLKGAKKWILFLIILSIGVGFFQAYLFQMMGMLVDWMSQADPQQFWQEKNNSLLLMGFFLILFIFCVLFAALTQNQTLAAIFPMRLRWRFHEILLSQSIKFYQEEFSGRLSAKVMQTALAVRAVVFNLCDISIYLLVYFVTSGLILAYFNILMLLPFIFWLGSLFIMMSVLIPKVSEVTQRQADARSMMTGRITDTYSNIETIKLFSQKKIEKDYTRFAMNDFLITVHQQMRLISLIEVAITVIDVLMISGMVILGLWLWSIGEISVGAFSAATALAVRLNSMAHWMMMELANLFENIGIIKDGMGTFVKKTEVDDVANAPSLNIQKGEVIFDHVSFSYHENQKIFSNFNLNIKPGEKVGLVGQSGSGKSTLLNLILRYFDIQSGFIFIDGQDIKMVSQESLRAQIGMVSQDVTLLHRTVRENIMFGRQNASEEEMIEAAKMANAHEFILGLSDSRGNTGYDTLVGERGIRLSGGQRQRISIARVMLKNAPILLLDEATSALDSEVESLIQNSLYQLMENKTVIAIAHRLSTIAKMDRLLVMKDGMIIEQGTHQELLKLNGLYADLWNRQVGGFLQED